MAHTARSSFFFFFAILSCRAPLLAEDVKLREQAVHLLEVANAMSLTGGLRNYEQLVTFTVHDSLTGSVKEGTFNRVSAGADGRRDEFTFGDYHAVIVFSGERLSSIATGSEPPEIRELRRNIPIHIGRFDHEDVIRSVDDMNVLGRPAKCINFHTQFGNELQTNQICVDAERGTLLLWHVGDELIENSQYFQIANLWEPGHIRRFMRGALQLEIEQSMTATEIPVDPKAFSPPSEHWHKWFGCQNERRPIGVSMPMPPAGTVGTGIVDVIVHAYISDTGTVQPTTIESSPRPDLNAEALKLVATWKFLPLMCGDQPATTEANLIVHFQGR